MHILFSPKKFRKEFSFLIAKSFHTPGAIAIKKHLPLNALKIFRKRFSFY
jgi:hypothetical protein